MAKTPRNGMKLRGLEREPKTYDYEGIIQWLVDSKWVEHYIIKQKTIFFPYLEDYIQEVWMQILSVDRQKIVDSFQVGKGRFIAFIKMIINNNIISASSPVYRNICRWDERHIVLSDVQWNLLESEVSECDYIHPIRKNKISVENPYDYLDAES